MPSSPSKRARVFDTDEEEEVDLTQQLKEAQGQVQRLERQVDSLKADRRALEYTVGRYF